ncbi:hypothetical protein [Frankia sp. QA3]|uniref:hypothetical protein n=1 Tax=Frankia sp. QA3 TaxID=710111 RepID=UPI000269BC9F|nr:hypothetical protein [Frankia sp. QA3]EIV91332.1 hypothetical protein FraQA3DRAFT_0773 [Frankia sp. QA3]
MRDPLTYGSLADAAARIATTAAANPPRPSARVGEILDHAAGIGRLLATAGRHAKFLDAPFGGSGRSTTFVNRLVTTALIADQLYAQPTPGHTPWHRAADNLGAAHDLLATHVDRAGHHRSLDAVILGDPLAVRGAMTRLTDITLAAALAARALPPLLAPFQTNVPSAIPAAQVLTRLGALAGPIRMSRERLHPTGDHALDPIAPLLGDPAAPPLDRHIHQVRRMLHQLSQPDALISQQALLGFANLAIAISDRTSVLTRRAATLTRGPNRAHLDIASEQAADTARSWRDIRPFLLDTTSRGTDGHQIPHLAHTTSRLLGANTRTGKNPDRRDLARALDVTRNAALLLPEIAERSGLAVQTLLAHQALLRPAATPTGSTTLGDNDQTWIVDAYRAATRQSGSTITYLLRLPGTHPQLARALYLVQRHAPEGDHDLLGLHEADPAVDETSRPSWRTPVLSEETDGTLRLHDPRHGTLQVDNTTLSTAVTRSPNALRGILAGHPWINLDGTETLITLAALVTAYAPEALETPATDSETGPRRAPSAPALAGQSPMPAAIPQHPRAVEPPNLTL